MKDEVFNKLRAGAQEAVEMTTPDLQETIIAQAKEYEKEIPADRWVDEYLMRGTVEVSGQWVRDVLTLLKAQQRQIQVLKAFRSAVVGWREADHHEGFSRVTAEAVADMGRFAELNAPPQESVNAE